MPMKSESRWT